MDSFSVPELFTDTMSTGKYGHLMSGKRLRQLEAARHAGTLSDMANSTRGVSNYELFSNFASQFFQLTMHN